MSGQKTATSTVDALLNGGVVQARYVDVTTTFLEQHGASVGELTPEVERRLRRKLYVHVLLLAIFINAMMFVGISCYFESHLLAKHTMVYTVLN